MGLKTRILLPGLVVPGGGYLAIGAWRQGLAFLSIGLLVSALWTDLFTQFRFGLLLFWAVLCLAGILGAEQVSRQSLGDGLGLAWIINGSMIYVALGLLLGFLLARFQMTGEADDGLDMTRARQILIAGEAAGYALGGVLLGLLAPRPVRTALWGAILAVGWSFVRGVNEVGVDAAYLLLRDRWPQLGVLYGICLGAAAFSALVVRIVLRRGVSTPKQPETRTSHPPPVTPARKVHTHGPGGSSQQIQGRPPH